MVEDQIPPKLIKTACNFVVKPLTDNINCTKYRPVSVLNTFSKIIESSIFDQLTKHATEFLQIFVWAYWKLYISQHILIR